ncbi:MAG: biotin/lipoyl-containing protein, partial [Pseudomonadales bacterium]
WQLLVRHQSHTQGDTSPWAIADGFRLNEAPYLVSEWRHHDQLFKISGTLTGNIFALQIAEQQFSGHAELNGSALSVELEQAAATKQDAAHSVNVRNTIEVAASNAGVTLFTANGRLDFACATPDLGDADTHSGSGDACAPMNGTVVSILVSQGDTVTAGDTLLIVEAMKMEHAIKAELDGEVTAIHCEVGQLVEGGAVLINITAGDSADAATDHA